MQNPQRTVVYSCNRDVAPFCCFEYITSVSCPFRSLISLRAMSIRLHSIRPTSTPFPPISPETAIISRVSFLPKCHYIPHIRCRARIRLAQSKYQSSEPGCCSRERRPWGDADDGPQGVLCDSRPGYGGDGGEFSKRGPSDGASGMRPPHHRWGLT